MFRLKKLKDISIIENQTEENCFFVLIKTKGEYIKFIDESNLNEDLVKLAIRLNGANIRFVPDKFINDKLYELAAIHGSGANLIKTSNQDILNIIDFIAEYSKKAKSVSNSRQTWDRYGYKNILINGEWTNLDNRFSIHMIEDNIRFMNYYLSNGYLKPTSPAGAIYFTEGKMYSLNSKIEDKDKFEFEIDESNFFNSRGSLNANYVKKCIIEKPEMILKLDPKYMSPKLIAYALFNGLEVEDIQKLKDLKGLETIKKLYDEHYLLRNPDRYENKNKDKLKEGKIKFFILNNIPVYTLLFSRYEEVPDCFVNDLECLTLVLPLLEEHTKKMRAGERSYCYFSDNILGFFMHYFKNLKNKDCINFLIKNSKDKELVNFITKTYL